MQGKRKVDRKCLFLKPPSGGSGRRCEATGRIKLHGPGRPKGPKEKAMVRKKKAQYGGKYPKRENLPSPPGVSRPKPKGIIGRNPGKYFNRTGTRRKKKTCHGGEEKKKRELNRAQQLHVISRNRRRAHFHCSNKPPRLTRKTVHITTSCAPLKK